LRAGTLRGAALAERILAVPPLDREAWTDYVLDLPEAPPDIELPRGAVPYLPAGVDEILTVVREIPVGEEDVFVDLGSGLGRVVILAHLLSGARGCGVELQMPLVQRARACAAKLDLSYVSFVNDDAANIDVDGSIFFLYSPFNGEMMRRVLRRLENAARRRAIVVCAVGVELPGEEWLLERRTSLPSVAIYESKGHGD
jgi:hypothetical protein